jgi:LPXTG-motif cell wall-anchored protein
MKIRAALLLAVLAFLAFAAPAIAATKSVSIGDNFYDPSSTTVSVGDTVTWTNHGQAPHSVTAQNGSFDSSPNCPSGDCLENGESYSHTFNSAGTFAYFCRVHGQAMSGTVVVESSGGGGGGSGGGGSSGGGGGSPGQNALPHTGPAPFSNAFPALGLLSLLGAAGLLLVLRRRPA